MKICSFYFSLNFLPYFTKNVQNYFFQIFLFYVNLVCIQHRNRGIYDEYFPLCISRQQQNCLYEGGFLQQFFSIYLRILSAFEQKMKVESASCFHFHFFGEFLLLFPEQFFSESDKTLRLNLIKKTKLSTHAFFPYIKCDLHNTKF